MCGRRRAGFGVASLERDALCVPVGDIRQMRRQIWKSGLHMCLNGIFSKSWGEVELFRDWLVILRRLSKSSTSMPRNIEKLP